MRAFWIAIIPLTGVALAVSAVSCQPPTETTARETGTDTTAKEPWTPGPATQRKERPRPATLRETRPTTRREAPKPRPADAQGSRVRVGDEAPDFELTTTDGQVFRLSDQRGKLVLLNFFATWCAPCLQEMPHLERDVYQAIRSDRFVMLAVGRNHSNAEVAQFKANKRLSFPMAGDPSRAVFDLYAEKSIPRSLVIGTDGRVVFQSIGYSDAEFKQMVGLLRAKLVERGR